MPSRTMNPKSISEKDNFNYLMGSLIFLLFASALVDQLMPGVGFGQQFILASIVISLTTSLWSIRSNKMIFKTSIGFIVGVIVLTFLGFLLEKKGLDLIHMFFMLCFFIMALWLAGQQVIFSGKVTPNSIVGSICIYLLLGIIWAIFYLMLLEISPESFSGIKNTLWLERFPQIVYFSFITLTTLGYGDLLPISPIAKFLAYMEAIVGVFYMAIFVSSLVGARMSAQQYDNHPK